MSSLSTVPKGDSAWLLRKAVQRVMQQVSVLETNIGTSTTGNSANTQVIFNDAGTLRGDPDLIFNTATNRLVALNLEATAALLVGTSATITGALGAAGLNVTGATIPANGVYLGSANNLSFSAASTLGMTLNSTGLGVGVSPAAKLDVLGNAALTGTSGFKYLYFNLATDINSVRGAKIGKNYDSPFDLNIHATTSATGLGNEAAIKFFRNNTDVSMTLDSAGNCGIGVTPSAWWSGFKAIESSNGVALLAQTNVPFAHIATNAIYNGTSWLYKVNSNYANRYAQDGTTGQHQWFTAPLGGGAAAGTAFTFTQAMTLDASGNLILLSSNTPATLTTNGQLTVNATSNTNLRFSYRGSDGVTRVANITLA